MIKHLTLKDVNIEIIAEQDHIPVEGNAIDSGDRAYDEKIEQEIFDRLNAGDIWAWAAIEVKVSWNHWSASAYLGACSYIDEEDFKSSEYYQDLVQEALDQLNEDITEDYQILKEELDSYHSYNNPTENSLFSYQLENAAPWPEDGLYLALNYSYLTEESEIDIIGVYEDHAVMLFDEGSCMGPIKMPANLIRAEVQKFIKITPDDLYQLVKSKLESEQSDE